MYDNGFIVSTCWVPYHTVIYTPLSYVPGYPCYHIPHCHMCLGTRAIVYPTVICAWVPVLSYTPLSYVPGYPCYHIPHCHMCLGTRAIIYPTVICAWVPVLSYTPAVICAWVPVLSYTPAIICAWYPHCLVCLGSPAFICGSEGGVCEALREGLIDNYFSSVKYVQMPAHNHPRCQPLATLAQR